MQIFLIDEAIRVNGVGVGSSPARRSREAKRDVLPCQSCHGKSRASFSSTSPPIVSRCCSPSTVQVLFHLPLRRSCDAHVSHHRGEDEVSHRSEALALSAARCARRAGCLAVQSRVGWSPRHEDVALGVVCHASVGASLTVPRIEAEVARCGHSADREPPDDDTRLPARSVKRRRLPGSGSPMRACATPAGASPTCRAGVRVLA